MSNPDENRRSNLREHLANERTLLSWIRLSLALIALGFVVARFGLFLAELFFVTKMTSVETGWSVPLGVVLMVAGPIFALLALRRYLVTEAEIETGQVRPHQGPIYTLVVATVLTGLGLALYLVFASATITHR